MRIIGGKFKSIRFEPPKNIPTRPTTDFAKEGLFNILNNHFDFGEIKVLDLFGGTGSISYEFYSRGCEDITTVEIFPRCAEFIKKTIQQHNMQGVKVHKMDVFKFMATTNQQYHVIFAGPPYPLPNLSSIPNILFEHCLLANDGWFILEHNPNHNFETHPNFLKSKNYGTTIFSIFTTKNITA